MNPLHAGMDQSISSPSSRAPDLLLAAAELQMKSAIPPTDRMPSTDGARHYRDHRSATSASFGTTHYEGRIAILHIDGNHAYSSVKADIEAWAGLVADGGWIVLDDYTWPFGDGPRRAADEFLTEHRARIGLAFVMGGALFMQVS